MQQLSFSNFELTVLSDGGYWLDGGAMFGVVPKPLWEKKIRADDMNRLRLGLNSLLVRTGEKNVLIETGIGNKLSDKSRRIYGNEEKLLTSLEQTGLSPEDIDVVINTHLHFDHCGWNTVWKDGRAMPTFPRATYYVQRGELEYAHEQRERDRVSYNTENYDPLVESGRMKLLQGAAEIVPGISVRVFPGHTRHMQAVVIRSGGQTACYIGDLIPTTAHLDLTWVMGYDLFPLDTIESRKLFYQECVPQQWLVVFTHDPQRPWAYVDSRGDGKYSWRDVAGNVSTPSGNLPQEVRRAD